MNIKPLFLLFSASLLATSCGAANYQLDLVVATPAGAPAVAFYRHVKSPASQLEINADPANVVGYLSANSGKDVVAAPTNAGIMAIVNKKAPYKIAANVTFGNFYLASTGNDDNGTLDADDYVIAFQQNNVPDKIFRSVYADLTNVHYLSGAADAQKALISGKDESNDNATVDYVLIAEPAFSAAKSKNPGIAQYADIQAEFKKAHDGLEITQASIFIANSADANKVKPFLNSIKADITSFVSNPDVINDYVKDLSTQEFQAKFAAPLAMLKTVTINGNRMGLGYKDAYENRASVANFMKLWGLASIDEEVFYK